MFIQLDGQSLEDLSVHWRVYYGEAWVNYIEKTDAYQVRYKCELESDGDLIRPSFFLNKSLIANGFNRALKEKKLTHYASEGKLVSVFVYGRPEREEGRDFLNFRPLKMDFVDIRDRV